jgi:hypothetical protein
MKNQYFTFHSQLKKQKSMKRFLLIACLLAISSITIANPVNDKVSLPPDDVGWCPGSDIIEFYEAQPVVITSDCSFTVFAPSESNIVYPLTVATLPITTRYERKRFVSFNKKINRWRIQTYGVKWDLDKERIRATAQYSPDVFTAYNYFKEQLYWLWSSKVKLAT